MTRAEEKPSVAALFEYLMKEFHIRNRAQLSCELEMDGSTMSRLGNGRQALSPKQILHIHEYFGVAVWKIRELSGQYDAAKEKPACRPAR